MMMTAVNPGEKIAVPRNSHKSMLGGLVMSGASRSTCSRKSMKSCTWITASRPKRWRVRSRSIRISKRCTSSSPTYYGVAADLASIERIVHDAGKLLLVDEAWGPHFQFHPALPLSATAAGADMCINSTHKMLSAFSQCAMLHQIGVACGSIG